MIAFSQRYFHEDQTVYPAWRHAHLDFITPACGQAELRRHPPLAQVTTLAVTLSELELTEIFSARRAAADG
jgi:hypothetical protein